MEIRGESTAALKAGKSSYRDLMFRKTSRLVAHLKKAELSAAPADHCVGEPVDVTCNFCNGRKMKAVKSCLVCLILSYKNHFQPDCELPAFKTLKLVNPSKNLQDNIYSETVPAAAERAEKQKKLQKSRQQIHQRIQDQEKDVKLLQQEVEAINVSADKAVEDSEKIFTQLIRLLREISSKLEQEIRSQQETEVSRVKDVQEKLEQEISELKRKDAELEQLSHTEDHNQFLLNYPSLPALSRSKHSSSIKIRPLRHFEDVAAAVTELRDKLQKVLKDRWTSIKQAITKVDNLLSEPEPKTRKGFLKYSQEINLDPNTANMNLLLSEQKRKVTLMNQQQDYPDHPDRFTGVYQVLSRERLIGRCYWEVNWSGGAYVAVSYQNINRTESFGFNDKSWSLYGYTDSYTFYHNSIETPVPGPVSSRLGVYLDHRAGILCFYSVSETPPQSPDQIHSTSTCWSWSLLLTLLFWFLLC